MKKVIKSASDSGEIRIKVVYMVGNNTTTPELRSFTYDTSGDVKQAIMDAVDNFLNLPWLGLDFNEPDTFDLDRLIDAIQYHNEVDVDYDYIFLLEVNGTAYIDLIGPEENYHG